jgi:hypothetical protein
VSATQRPLVAGVEEPPVACEPSDHHMGGARGPA